MRRPIVTSGRTFLTGRSGLQLALGFVLILAGCSSSGLSTPGSSSATPGQPAAEVTADRSPCLQSPTGHTGTAGGKDQPPGLESVLYGLVTADNRTGYASDRDLTLRDDSVEVVFELRTGAEVPSGFDVSIETRHENLVQAFVPVCELVSVSEHENVSYVRSPRRPVPDEPSLDTFDT